MELLITILVGIVAGYLGGLIFKGKGNGVILNLIIGLIGGVVGHFLLGFIGFASAGIIAEIICATIGAIVLLWIISLIRK
jgi:uncharacterized membrane protein YeaQ/YmgE (transglycosylase-associated protein family)